MKTIKIFGGGIAGLTAAHELVCRGFEVIVHEPRPAVGGKARSQFSGELPGEHGFRFFPGWYLHVSELMSRIPVDPEQADLQRALDGYAQSDSVLSRLLEVRRTLTFRKGAPPLSFLQVPESIAELPEFLKGFSWVLDGLDPVDQLRTLKRLGLALTLFYSTPPWLRAGRFDDQSLADLLGADSLPAPVRRSLKTVPKALVAMDAYEGSAHTFLNTNMLNVAPAWNRDLPKDRVLRGPTSRTWFDPWVQLLKRLGVHFVHGDEGCAVRVTLDGRRVASVETRAGRTETADAIVLALPVGALQRVVIASDLGRCGSDFAAVASLNLERQASEMVGLQLYLDRPLNTQPGHLFFPDSQYGLTAISQMEIWDDEYNQALRREGVEGLLSIDITQWREDPFERTPPPYPVPFDLSTPKQLADAVIEQLKQYPQADGTPLVEAERVVAFHVDQDVNLATEENRAELLIHPPGTWGRRPLAKTSVERLYLASDFVKNPADLATMEGACSAGKLAANEILAELAPQARPAKVHDLVEELQPSWMKTQQQGFEALIQGVGGFDRAANALRGMLDAGDGLLNALEALQQVPHATAQRAKSEVCKLYDAFGRIASLLRSRS